MTLYTYLRERAREHPNRIVRDETRSMTFSKLFEEAEEIGRTLSGRLYGILCRSDLDTALPAAGLPVGGQDRRTAVTAIRQGPCGKDPTGGGALLHPDRAGTAHGRIPSPEEETLEGYG